MSIPQPLRYVAVIIATAVIVAPATAFAGQQFFADVPPDSQFFEEIQWMAANGITQGCDDSLYCPNDNVTRQQMAAFMQRLAEAQVVDAGLLDGRSGINYKPTGLLSDQSDDSIDIGGNGTVALGGVIVNTSEECGDGSISSTWVVTGTGHTNNMNDGESAHFAIRVNGEVIASSRQALFDANGIFHVQTTVSAGASTLIELVVEENEGDVYIVRNPNITAQLERSFCVTPVG